LALHIFTSARAILEATRGAGGTPTRLLYFDQGSIQQDVKTIRPQQLRNSYFGFYSAAAGTETNTITMSGILSYQDAVWLGNTHIKAIASGTGAGADKVYSFVPSSATDDIKSALIQFGYSDGIGAGQPAASVAYCLGDELTLKWDKSGDGLVTFDSKMVTPKALTQITAFTGALSNRTVSLASCNTTQVYVDPTTIGTTADNYWLDATWTLTNGYHNLYTLNNTTAAQDTLRPNARTWKLEGTRYYGGTVADAEWDAYISKAVRKIRIKTVGPTLGSSTFILQLDLYGVYTSMQNAEVDGLGVQNFTMEPVYDTTATTDFALNVTSDEGSIT
jgi:hypothetical protein